MTNTAGPGGYFTKGCGDDGLIHIIYTSIRSDTRLSRYSADTDLRVGRFQIARNMTR